MNAFVVCVGAIMNVTVNVGLHVGAWRKYFPKLFRIDKSSGEMNGVTTQSGIVVCYYDGGLINVVIESFG